MSDRIHIDGSQGEGGGQVLRTALALSVLTGKTVHIENIRAKRKRPGLMRQHLTAVKAAIAISGARAEGAELGSVALSFAPGPVRGGTHRFAVGTAGSASLVLQTVLVPLLFADRPSSVTVEGGTHNPMAPPYDFLAKAFLPLLSRMGARVAIDLERPGFYPAGGGRMQVEIEPSTRLEPLDLLEAGPVRARRARALVSELSPNIGRRELEVLKRRLGLTQAEVSLEEVKSAGPGNALVVEVERAEVTEIVTGFGERGVPAEKVATRVADEVERYARANAPVGEHLQDQLLLPLAVAGGGRFVSVAPSSHAETNARVIERFLDVRVDVERDGDDRSRIAIAAAR